MYIRFRVLAASSLLVLSAGCVDEPSAEVEIVQSALIQAPGGCGQVPSDSVCACTNTNFSGSCMNFTNATRFYMNLGVAPYTPLNNSISSLWIGPDAKARFCTDPGMGGWCVSQNGTAGAGFSRPNVYLACEDGCACGAGGGFQCLTGWCCLENKITSIRVDKLTDNCLAPGLSQVSVFEDPNYQGDCVVLNRGTYNSATANPTNGQKGGGWGLKDNSISSVQIGVPGMGHNFGLYNGTDTAGDDMYYSGAQYTPALSAVGFENKTSSLFVN